eukprot:COSAG02_NODE_3661_length_6407_cov_7.761297_5_plen_148_part_00
MEFASRQKCIEHYQDQFPNLPRYMIEMALDYDLAQGEGSASNEKPLTGKEKRKLKQVKKRQQQEPVNREFSVFLKDALENGKPLEIDCARVLKPDDYEMPPFVKGHIEVDGSDVTHQLQDIEPEPEPEPEPASEAVAIEEVTFDADF